MQPLLTSEEMAEADAYTIKKLGVPGIELMERAAGAYCDFLKARFPVGAKVAVAVGLGNNGGDGLAIARLLIESGYSVTTWLFFPDGKYRGDALTNYDRLVAMGGEIKPAAHDFPGEEAVAVIVDAVFGTGLNRPVEGRLAELILQINRHPARVMSVDLPSGLNGSQGRLLGACVQADWTVTFQNMKLAHGITPASAICGDVFVCPIGIEKPKGATHNAHLIEANDFRRPSRGVFGHKGSYGALAVIGGFAGMEGAANLAAMAALRFGVGKVRVYTNNRNRFRHDSVMVANINHYQPGYHALVIGPGLGRGDEAQAHLRRLNFEKDRILWDADGLLHLYRRPNDSRGREWVMTPHPGEAAMLLDCLSREIQLDRLAAVAELRNRYSGGWILLKGNRTLISSPEGHLYVCKPGGAALAVAGSGDVLSGMIGSLLAQGEPARDAVLIACLRHGMAGDRWSMRHPDYSMLAEDIIDDLKVSVPEQD